jgi:dienelactone hydrolase
VIGVEERDGAIVRDIHVAADDGPTEAYLVEPTPTAAAGSPRTAGRGGRALLFAHWYDPQAPNGNRTEYLDEATAWARERGATAILPQLRFPWAADPEGSSADAARIREEVTRLRRCLDVLAADRGVDARRIGVVGHDFGAMHAILLATEDRRPTAYVLMAAIPRWGDWFLPFWKIEEDRIEYLRALRPLDPIEHVGRAAPAKLLFQFGLRDWYIAPMAGFEFRRAAGESAEVKSYEAEHDMTSSDALADRTAFLETALAPASIG